jgi:hypothetical protein
MHRRIRDAFALAAVAAGAVAVHLLLPGRASAQDGARPVEPPPVPSPAALDSARLAAEQAHLRRVGAWGLASLVGGTALALGQDREDHPSRHGFGLQTAAWGGINTAIAAGGLLLGGRGEAPHTLSEAVGREERWNRILLVNVGLNAGYMMTGAALVMASHRGLERGDEVRGHATAVILQGLGLLVLDGVAWWESRDRLQETRSLLDRLEWGALPSGGVGVSIPLP